MTTSSWLRAAVVAAAAGSAGRLSVLLFHRVHATADPLFPGEPDKDRFEACMEVVRDCFTPMPLFEACEALDRGRVPPRAVAITFDDGYADNFQVALPVLKRLGLHATFFVASSYLDGGRMWNDSIVEAVRRCAEAELDLTHLSLGRYALKDGPERRAAIQGIIGALKYLDPVERSRRAEAIGAKLGVSMPSDLMMTSAQVRDLASAGMTVGAHTCSHPILARISDGEARREIADGREQLEGIVRSPVRLFAYPNGKPGQDYLRVHVDMVSELGFRAAVSTAPGAADRGGDRWQIPRFTPWDPGPERFALRLAASRRQRHYASV
jgi:peptidoglycan/xylan/chitin deacetylase (PgdA/CDA1 family)